MKKNGLLGIVLCIVSVLYADIDTEVYYASAEGKSGAELKTALSEIIKDHVDVGYGGLYEVYETSDDRDGQVWDMYSTCTWTHGDNQCGNYSNVCDCHNREHVIPQSWFDKQTPMRSDAFHVYPTDGKVNGMRSNYPHGETNASPIGGKALGKLGSCSVSGYSGTVYEPADEYKGDIARTYFYFVTCYEDKMASFDVNDVFTGESYPSLKPWFYNLMLKWHRNDPVSQKEIDRNNAIYEYQENRNPFIDYPDMAEHIWGNKMNEDFSFSKLSTSTDEIVNRTVFVDEGVVYILDLAGEDIVVYDLWGKMVYSVVADAPSVELKLEDRGIYLLKIGEEVIKIAY